MNAWLILVQILYIYVYVVNYCQTLLVFVCHVFDGAGGQGVWTEGVVDRDRHAVRLTKLQVRVDPCFERQVTTLMVHHSLTVHPLVQHKIRVVEANQAIQWVMILYSAVPRLLDALIILPLNPLALWQPCLFRYQLDFSGNHSATL